MIILASANNSPDHSSTGTFSPRPTDCSIGIGLEQLVCIRFQVLFHSPSGVLFAFPSRYLFTIGSRRVFSLGEWSPQLPTGFHVPDGTQELAQEVGPLSLTGLSPSMVGLSRPFN